MKLGVLVGPVLLAVCAFVAVPAAIAQETVPSIATEAAQAPGSSLKYSNKWRIEVKEGANNDGVLRFRVTPQGEAPIDVTVNLKKGRSENSCAKDVRAAFEAALDPKRFHVERDDWEDVLVKKKLGAPDFALELVERTVKGTHVDLERE